MSGFKDTSGAKIIIRGPNRMSHICFPGLDVHHGLAAIAVNMVQD